MSDRGLPSSRSDAIIDAVVAAGEGISNPLRQPVDVEEIDQLPVLPVSDYLFDRWGARADEKASRGHCLHQRPRQHEGVGETHMNPRNLQYCEILVIWQASEKMHSPQIERAAQLGKQLCPVVGGFLASAPVADPVAAHDENLCLRSLFENSRQGPHENMEPAIRFEVARAVGDDFICAG